MSQEKKCNTCARVYGSESDFLQNTSRWRVGFRDMLYFNCSCGSTLVLGKGQYEWYSPEKLLKPEAAVVFNRVASKQKIPMVPGHLIELQEKIRDPNLSTEEICKALRGDPFVSSELIKVANLSSKASTGSVRSLEHAVVYVGQRAISDLVAALAVKVIEFRTKTFKHDQFWKESFLTGAVAERIALKVPNALSADEIYLAGCLCNIGKVMGAACLPEVYDAVAEYSQNRAVSWSKAEIDLKAEQHTILGEIAATFWGLPEYVMAVNSLHHRAVTKFARYSDEMIVSINIVTFANQCVHWLLGQSYRMENKLTNELSNLLGFGGNHHEFLNGLKPLLKNL